MKKNITICATLLLLVVSTFLAAQTFARYRTSKNASTTVETAQWGVNVTKDGTADFTGAVALTLSDTAHVVDGKMAPSRSGYFDVVVDYSGTEVSFDYDIVLGEVTPNALPAGMAITGYKTATTLAGLEGAAMNPATDSISVEKRLAETTTGFAVDSKDFVRVYIEWNNDDAQSEAHTDAAGQTYNVPIAVTAEQYIPVEP